MKSPQVPTQQQDDSSDEVGQQADGDVIAGVEELGAVLYKPSHLLHVDTGHQIYKKETLSLSVTM